MFNPLVGFCASAAESGAYREILQTTIVLQVHAESLTRSAAAPAAK
jgi:hypothetical protein